VGEEEAVLVAILTFRIVFYTVSTRVGNVGIVASGAEAVGKSARIVVGCRGWLRGCCMPLRGMEEVFGWQSRDFP
jgi:hypothetical protein